ncbi:MAG TPA: patatin-like phospholipase family protein [Thermoleophilaceae bacterium]|jgi:NTE family protein
MTTSAPDVLVLGAGGILGEAWMSAVLAGIESEAGFDARECRAYVGTSAGSIVAAALAAGVRPDARLRRLPAQPPAASGGDPAHPAPAAGVSGVRRALGATAAVYATAAAPVVALALSSAAPGGALVRRAALGRLPRGRTSLRHLRHEVDRLAVEWDGRLRIAAVELESGRRVVFGADGAPEVPVADAVTASCAIPGVFRPFSFGGRSYVDGGAWSLTNMDLAGVRRGDRVLCLNPTGGIGPNVGAAIAPVSRSVAAAEAVLLRGRGAAVDTVNPDRASVAAMGPNLMDPRPRDAVVAAGLAQGRRLGAGLAVAAAA